jgi:hypothetical protein
VCENPAPAPAARWHRHALSHLRHVEHVDVVGQASLLLHDARVRSFLLGAQQLCTQYGHTRPPQAAGAAGRGGRCTTGRRMAWRDTAPNQGPAGSASGVEGGGISDEKVANRDVGVWHGATRKWPFLERWTNPKLSRPVRVHVGTGYNRVEGNRRNGFVSDLPPEIPHDSQLFAIVRTFLACRAGRDVRQNGVGRLVQPRHSPPSTRRALVGRPATLPGTLPVSVWRRWHAMTHNSVRGEEERGERGEGGGERREEAHAAGVSSSSGSWNCSRTLPRPLTPSFMVEKRFAASTCTRVAPAQRSGTTRLQHEGLWTQPHPTPPHAGGGVARPVSWSNSEAGSSAPVRSYGRNAAAAPRERPRQRPSYRLQLSSPRHSFPDTLHTYHEQAPAPCVHVRPADSDTSRVGLSSSGPQRAHCALLDVDSVSARLVWQQHSPGTATALSARVPIVVSRRPIARARGHCTSTHSSVVSVR